MGEKYGDIIFETFATLDIDSTFDSMVIVSFRTFLDIFPPVEYLTDFINLWHASSDGL
jgi:hypothetical protein